MHATMPEIDLAAIPLGVRGSGSLNIESTSDRGSSSDIGAFRIPCAYSHMAFNDPIVYPGQPGRAHLHTFFGNTASHVQNGTFFLNLHTAQIYE